jgi:hypothetical protein
MTSTDHVRICLDQLDLVRQVREVGRKDRGGQPAHPAYVTGGRAPPAQVGAHPPERGHEHRVGPVAVRPQAGPLEAVRTLDRLGLQVRPSSQERVAYRVGLGARDRADRVHEPASGGDQSRRGRRDPHLETRQPRDVGLAGPPQELGTPSGRPDPRAGGVDQDAVEPLADRRPTAVLEHEERPDAEALRRPADEPQPSLETSAATTTPSGSTTHAA